MVEASQRAPFYTKLLAVWQCRSDPSLTRLDKRGVSNGAGLPGTVDSEWSRRVAGGAPLLTRSVFSLADFKESGEAEIV